MDTTTPDWTSLPQDLLISIAKRLHTRIDILRFRAVCRSFRCTLPRPPKLLFPHSILKIPEFVIGPNSNDRDLFLLTESTVYAIDPLNKIDGSLQPQTWLVKVKESSTGKVQIKDPLSGLCFQNLSKKSLNLLDYRVKEIAKSYVLESAAFRKGKRKLFDNEDGIEYRKPYITARGNMEFSSFLDENDDGFAVMAKFGEKELYVWRNADKKWVNIDMEPDYPEASVDIVYHNHAFYTLISSGSTIIVDSESLTVVEVGYPEELEDLSFLYLVESLKDLFLIAVYDRDKEGMSDYYVMVFKLDEEKRKWVRVVDELEDRVFFVGGCSTSYSVSAKELYGYKENCVYFTDDGGFEDIDEDGSGKEVWIFNLKDHTVEKLSDSSDLFCPPPTWLKQQYSYSAGCCS